MQDMDSLPSMKLFAVASVLIIVGMVNAGRNDRRDTCSNSDTPCYDYALTYIMDGRTENFFGGNRTEILAHNWLVGRTEADVIQEGKMATQWLLTKYGINFTDVEDEVYLDASNAVTSDDGNLTFTAFMVDPAARYRLVSASKEHKVEFFNAPISDAGWAVIVNEDYSASGTFDSTLPQGAMIVYGDYIIPLCDQTETRRKKPKGKGRNCRNLFNQSTLKIHYESSAYMFTVDGVIVIDCIVKETSWGVGIARGASFMEPDNLYSTRNVLTFPATAP
ncbi:uncharacterized protein LOC106161784 [Lingula anatina]|uniref:Uncharacterized protein LOC106161784 n=1 Tax=Lingula anatina TaxID=7574 RepID=A0A1S3I7M7_LINAN|nr:uncharacterized protein LOC106161784 [Lingula anatina]|eukprot:XP_013394262.1 uncharacterized protein LOC106161784 [Lingula anatina]